MEDSAAQNTSRTPIVALVVSFAALDLWCDLLGHAVPFAPAAQAVQDAATNGRVFWNLILVVFCAAVFMAPRALECIERPGDVAAVFLACAGTAVYVIFGPTSPVVAGGMIAVTGIAYGWLEVRLLANTARVAHFGTVVWLIATSRILKTLLEPLVAACAPLLVVVVCCALPLVPACSLLFALCPRGSENIVHAAEKLRISLPETDQMVVLALLIVCPISNSVARALSNLGFWGGNNLIVAGGFGSAALACMLFAGLVAASFSRVPDTDEIVKRFILAIVMLMGCIMLFSQQSLDVVGLPVMVSDALSGGTELFSHFLFWLSAVAAIRMVDQHPYRLAALTELSMSALAIVLGLLLQTTTGVAGLVVEALLYALVVAAVWFALHVRGVTEAPAQNDDLQATCARIAQEHHLTPREVEVFTLLAQGRSRTFIQNELVLSDSTIKTYTNHVYQKLGVHSKQDLISLVRPQ